VRAKGAKNATNVCDAIRSIDAVNLRRHFTEHPASVGETWGEHCRVALGFSRDLALASGVAAIHALVPSLCRTTASRRICALHERMTTGARAANAPGHLTAVPDRPAAEGRRPAA
jgi:hypothetical protein